MQSSETAKFDFSTWKNACLENEKEKERVRLSVLEEVNKALYEISLVYEWKEVFIFGSIIKPGQFSSRSDVDIGIGGLNKFLHYRLVADLSGILDRSVDVVRLEDCSFAEVIRTRGRRWKKEK